MKKWLISILMLVLSFITYAQSDNDCAGLLKKLINKVEKEYPGFHVKTKDAAAYTAFKNNLINTSLTVGKDSCYKILRAYTKYFNDGHLGVNKVNNSNSVVKNSPNRTNNVDVKNFTEYVANSRDSLEGIWTSDNYKVGVIKNKTGYEAFIISSQNESWKQNEIKFSLDENGKGYYYLGDHSQKEDTYSIIKNSIIYFKKSNVSYVKEHPKPIMTSENISKEINLLEGFYIKEMNSKTLLLRITSFMPQYTKRIEKLFEDNRKLLSNHKYLIIDVRGNTGGTDYSLSPILPYIYSNPVRFLGGEYLVTKTLINGLKNWSDSQTGVLKDSSDLKYVRNALQRMEGKLGEYIPYSEGDSYGYIKQDSVYQYPQNVAIIIDKHCGSTTEKFIFNAKQSKKVKLFGTPTYGSIDYVSLRNFDFGTKDYILYMPTVRMMRLSDYPLDNIGIQPDIYMDKYVGDWVQYAKEYLEN